MLKNLPKRDFDEEELTNVVNEFLKKNFSEK